MNIIAIIGLKDIIKSIQDNLGDITLYLLFALFIYMFFCDVKDFLSMLVMVLKIYRSDKKNEIIRHINCLLKANAEYVDKITNFQYIRTWYEHKLDDTIKEYTTRQEKESKFGVKEKKKSVYYTDLQKACIEDENDLDIIAFSIALLIINKIDIYDKSSYFIVGQSDGNSILARRVASILGLRFVIVGNLAGKEDVVFGKYYPSEKAILVDDIIFTGSMLIENLRTLDRKK